MANIIAITGGYKNEDAIDNLIKYMTDPINCRYDLSQQANMYNFYPEMIANAFKTVQKAFVSEEGKRICHMIIGFENWEIDEPEIVEVMKIAIDYFKQKYLVFGVIHEGSRTRLDEYLHIHLAINSISHVDGSRFYDSDDEYNKFENYMSQKCPSFNWDLIRKTANLKVH